jgi:hypothetical protein
MLPSVTGSKREKIQNTRTKNWSAQSRRTRAIRDLRVARTMDVRFRLDDLHPTALPSKSTAVASTVGQCASACRWRRHISHILYVK